MPDEDKNCPRCGTKRENGYVGIAEKYRMHLANTAGYVEPDDMNFGKKLLQENFPVFIVLFE